MAFNVTRRMRRDPDKAALLPDPLREAVGLPIGIEGAYFVGGDGEYGQDTDESILDYNYAPGAVSMSDFKGDDWLVRYRQAQDEAFIKGAQPGLWCQWTVDDEGEVLCWDEGEKFYNYVEWLEYLIEHFFKPWGRTLSGRIDWYGEDSDDRGAIFVQNNEVRLNQPDPIKNPFEAA